MTAVKFPRTVTEPFIGLESRPVSRETLDRAHRSTDRTRRANRIAKKLDELLGPADADWPEAEGE